MKNILTGAYKVVAGVYKIYSLRIFRFLCEVYVSCHSEAHVLVILLVGARGILVFSFELSELWLV